MHTPRGPRRLPGSAGRLAKPCLTTTVTSQWRLAARAFVRGKRLTTLASVLDAAVEFARHGIAPEGTAPNIATLTSAVSERGWHVHLEELTRDRSGRRRFNALVWCRPDGARFGIHVRGRGFTEEDALATAVVRMLRHQPA